MTLAILESARHLLLRRIEQHSDAQCTSLLGLLDGLTSLHERLDDSGRALIVAAAEPMAEAARQVTFDSTRGRGPMLSMKHGPVPTRPEPPTLPVLVDPLTALRRASGDAAVQALALLDALESLQAELIFAADVQEYVDARHNAGCYLRAAAQILLAAEPLAALGQRIAGSGEQP